MGDRKSPALRVGRGWRACPGVWRAADTVNVGHAARVGGTAPTAGQTNGGSG